MNNDVIHNITSIRINKDKIDEILRSSENLKISEDNHLSAISDKEKKNLIIIIEALKESMIVFEERCVELLRE